jgi:hypothetical protein
MHVTEIIESFTIRNPANGRECSPYGAIPPGYTERVGKGWTVRLSNGTVGTCRGSFPSREAAAEHAREINDRAREGYRQHARLYPDQAGRCEALIERIPEFGEVKLNGEVK